MKEITEEKKCVTNLRDREKKDFLNYSQKTRIACVKISSLNAVWCSGLDPRTEKGGHYWEKLVKSK